MFTFWGKKFIKNAKICQLGEFLKILICGQKVLPDNYSRTKIGGIPKSKAEMEHFGDLQTLWHWRR